ncbi:MAG: OadG family protein [Oscillospiraceae bacterium]|nr:OadG family protein [Oscillospiraceae bacterium]
MNLMNAASLITRLEGGIDGDVHMDGGQIAGVTVAGLGVVFAVLVLLVLIIFLFNKIFEAIYNSQRKKEISEAAQSAPKSDPVPAAAAKPAAPAVKAAAQDDDEVIAVISAVVAMMSEADGRSYRVKSVKPVQGFSGRTAWAMDGRRQNVAPF